MPGRPDLSEPRLAELYAYWDGKRAGRVMPTRADIDPLEMRPWLGHLLLIEIGADRRFVYRLYGTAFVESFGIDMTGKSVDDLPAEQQERLRADYEAVCASRQPRVRLYTGLFESDAIGSAVRQEAQVITWERLVLPLCDGTDSVAMLLVGAYPLSDLKPSTA